MVQVARDISQRRRVNPAQQQLIALSDERDMWSERVKQAWRDGYAAGEAAHADDYGEGYYDGILHRKRAEHEHVERELLDFLRWGPGGRERYGDPRVGDFPGHGLDYLRDTTEGEAA